MAVTPGIVANHGVSIVFSQVLFRVLFCVGCLVDLR